MGAYWTDLVGTIKTSFRIGFSGPTLKASSANLLVRNSDDSADAEITASKVNTSGNDLVINSAAAGAGADWSYTLSRPTSGMTAAVTLTLPIDDGTAGQVLATDGNGALSWTSAGVTTLAVKMDTTTLAFNSAATVTMFTLPASNIITMVEVVIDTAFDGTPTMTVGVNGGSASKYVGSGDILLTSTAKTVFHVHPGEPAVGGTEDLEIAYSAGGAAAGSARVIVHYGQPA